MVDTGHRRDTSRRKGVLSMGRVQYSEQFKREAVRLVTEEGYPNNL